MKKPLLQGNVSPLVFELFEKWYGNLHNKKHKGVLLSSCVLLAAKFPDELRLIFGDLIRAEGVDGPEGIEKFIRANFRSALLDAGLSGEVKQVKPLRAARGAKHQPPEKPED